MNYKQKSGYMLLGAGLLAVGIIIGRLIEPSVGAGSNGVFDKIQCRELEVVDTNGNQAIGLRSAAKLNELSFYDKQSNLVMSLVSIDEVGSGLSVYDRYGRLMIGLTSSSGWDNLEGSGLTVYNQHGNAAVELTSTLRGNEVSVYDRFGNVVGELVTKEDNWVPFGELTR